MIRLPVENVPCSALRRANSAVFLRWIIAAFVLIVGFLLWIGVLSDPSGRLSSDAGSILYVAVVVGIAALVAFADRNRKRKKGRRS